MNEQRLQSLLMRADASAVPPVPTDGDLAERVRVAARRRQRVRRGVQAVAVAALIVTAGTVVVREANPRHDDTAAIVHRPSLPTSTTEPVPSGGRSSGVAALRAELASLDAQAHLHERIARCLTERQESRQAVPVDEPVRDEVDLDPVYGIAQEVEVAARLMVLRADWLAAESPDRAGALAAYRRTIDLFPMTVAADAARERLLEWTTFSGDQT